MLQGLSLSPPAPHFHLPAPLALPMPGLALCLQHTFLQTVASLVLSASAGPALPGAAAVPGDRLPAALV